MKLLDITLRPDGEVEANRQPDGTVEVIIAQTGESTTILLSPEQAKALHEWLIAEFVNG